ncbi:hypothetical protein GEMRC1_000728 [Eukaryota sp. GEM-RC1]
MLPDNRQPIPFLEYVKREYGSKVDLSDVEIDLDPKFQPSYLKIALWIVSCALLVVIFVAAHTPSADLVGKVVDSRSDLPVPSVSVLLLLDGELSLQTLTDSEGSFSFPKVKVGLLRLSLTHSTYYNHTKQIGHLNKDDNDLLINLDPMFYQYSGIVSDDVTGQLLKEVKVTVTTPQFKETVVTNSQGVFTIGLWSGSYSITLDLLGYHSVTDSFGLSSFDGIIPFVLSRYTPNLNIIVLDKEFGFPLGNVVVVLESFDVFSTSSLNGEVSFSYLRPGLYFLALYHPLYHNLTTVVNHGSTTPQSLKLTHLTSQVVISIHDSLSNVPLMNGSADVNTSLSSSTPIENGLLVFDNLRLDLYEIELSHHLYFNKTILVNLGLPPLSIVTSLDPVLVSRTGLVLSNDNSPIEGARVKVVDQSIITDSDGAFTLSNLRLKTFVILEISHRRFNTTFYTLEVIDGETEAFEVLLEPIFQTVIFVISDSLSAVLLSNVNATIFLEGVEAGSSFQMM